MSAPSPIPDKIPWTTPQRRAIEHAAGDLLVSAAAGSGKTAVLAERCARLVCGAPTEKPTGIDNLLVVTFTEAAASEMRTRIGLAIERTLVDQTSAGISADHSRWLRRQAAMVDRAAISTLHAFCARVLRQHFHEADVDPAFEVMDEDEARLLRDDVLHTLMTQWHKLPPKAANPRDLSGERFTEFFESYAQGREGTCCDMILSVHRMLSTTADPADYLSRARAVYADADATFASYNAETLMHRLRLVLLAAQRAHRELQRVPLAEPMRDGLERACKILDNAMDALKKSGPAAWPAIRDLLQFKWPTLKTIKEIDNFEPLKKRTWQKTKDSLADLAQSFKPDPAVMLKELGELAGPLDTLLALTADFQSAFTAAKRADNRLDFNDLERLTLDMFRRPDQFVTQELRRRYHHVLVDEFQDINPLQAALLNVVRNPAAFDGTGNLFRVGDVKQSIYGFRLAEPNLFLNEERAAREHDAAHIGKMPMPPPRHIALPHNFRSQPALLAAMNGIFERLLTLPVAGVNYHDGHALQPAPPKVPPMPSSAIPPAKADEGVGTTSGTPIEVHFIVNDMIADDADDHHENSADPYSPAPAENLSAVEHEARMVADRIASLLAEGRTIPTKTGTRPLQPRDIAVLLRAMKDKAMIFARAFARRGIPFHAELTTGYFDTPEIANTLALLHVLDNPQQDIPLATLLLGPFGNFTHDDLTLIRLTYDRKEVPFCTAAARYATDAATPNETPPGLLTNHPPFSASLAQRLADLFKKLATWRDRLRTQPLHEGLAEIYADSQILAYAAGLDAGTQRVANLQQLHQSALKFGTFRKQGLHRFLRSLERLQDQEALGGGGGGDTGEAAVLSEASNVVRIMSIHKSKGLEFPVVVVACLGSMLNRNAGTLLIHRDLGIGLDVIKMDRNVRYPSAASLRIRDAQARSLRAEELRLLYVAMTRARDALILTGSVAKSAKIDEWKTEWTDLTGPLPEDVLLKGQRPLDWLMPAIAAANDPQVAVTLHARAAEAAKDETPTADAATIARLLALQPLDNVPINPEVERALTRIHAIYPHADLALRPAVQTVTFLKTIAPDATAPDEETPAPAPALAALEHDAAARDAQADAARLRGIATHRVLQLLDLTQLTPAAIDTQMAAFLQRKAISQNELDLADWTGIRWFLEKSKAGQRLRAAANSKNPATLMRRELPFACLAPASLSTHHSSLTPEDLPTLRGIIDALIANPTSRTAELLDYKTDSTFLWQSRLEDYRRQMQYYLHAATDILGFPVTQATLIFLSPRQEITVRLEG